MFLLIDFADVTKKHDILTDYFIKGDIDLKKGDRHLVDDFNYYKYENYPKFLIVRLVTWYNINVHKGYIYTLSHSVIKVK